MAGFHMANSRFKYTAVFAAGLAAYFFLGAPARQPAIPGDLRDAPNSGGALEQLVATGRFDSDREYLAPPPAPVDSGNQQRNAVNFPGNDSREAKVFIRAEAASAKGRTGIYNLDRHKTAPPPKKEFLIIGHSGAPHKEIENTVKSFQAALDEGANAIEADVCVTADGVLALWHDWDSYSTVANLRQMGVASYKYAPFSDADDPEGTTVADISYQHLRKYYGYRLPSRGSEKILNVIPTFEDMAKWASGKGALKLIYLDIKIPENKAGLVPAVVDNITELGTRYGILDKLLFVSPSLAIVQAARSYALGRGYALKIGMDREMPVKVFMEPESAAVPLDDFRLVSDAARLGIVYTALGQPTAATLQNGWVNYQRLVSFNIFLKQSYPETRFIAWTIDDEEDSRWLIERGVDGIMTNRTDVVARAVKSARR